MTENTSTRDTTSTSEQAQTYHYRAAQLDCIPRTGEYAASIQINRDGNHTNHLGVSDTELAQISDILTGCDSGYQATIAAQAETIRRYREALERVTQHAFDDDTPVDTIIADFEHMRDIARAELEGSR